MRNKIYAIPLLLLISVFAITACGSSTPAAPTEDPIAMVTRIAATVQWNLTQTAQAQPTATPTPEPTMTATPTVTLPALPTIDISPTAQSTTSVTNPTRQSYTGDHARWSYSHPADGYSTIGNTDFLLVFGLVNDGSTTWTTDYSIRNIYGYPCQFASNRVDMPNEVKPGELVEIFLRCFTPEAEGEYLSHWAVFTSGGVQVPTEFYFKFYVE